MRAVSSPTETELAKEDTEPAFLVRISFDGGINRFCTRGTVTWDGATWLGAALTVQQPSDSEPRGSLVFVDTDYAIHAAIFSGVFKSRAVDIWKFYGAALAVDDPVHVASCITAGADSGEGRRMIQLQRLGATLLQCPREIVGPPIGCHFLAPPGTQIAWGGKILILESPDA